MNYFKECNTRQEVKDTFRKLAMKYHWIDSNEEKRQYKDQFKEFMRWSKNKKKWYYTPLPYRRMKQTVSMNDIRNHYGSETVRNNEPAEQLT